MFPLVLLSDFMNATEDMTDEEVQGAHYRGDITVGDAAISNEDGSPIVEEVIPALVDATPLSPLEQAGRDAFPVQ